MEQLKSKEYTSIAKLMRGFLEEIELVPYSSGADNRSTCARRTIPPSSASPNDKTAYIMFRASFLDLWYVTIGR